MDLLDIFKFARNQQFSLEIGIEERFVEIIIIDELYKRPTTIIEWDEEEELSNLEEVLGNVLTELYLSRGNEVE